MKLKLEEHLQNRKCDTCNNKAEYINITYNNLFIFSSLRTGFKCHYCKIAGTKNKKRSC